MDHFCVALMLEAHYQITIGLRGLDDHPRYRQRLLNEAVDYACVLRAIRNTHGWFGTPTGAQAIELLKRTIPG